MPDSFAAFGRRLTRSYVLLAVALIALVVVTTSVLAFMLYVGTLDAGIASEAQRAAARAASYAAQNEPPRRYAAALVDEFGSRRVGVRVYDAQHRLLASSHEGPVAAGRFTRTLVALAGLHSAVVPVSGGTIVVVPELAGFARLLGTYLAVVVPIGALAVCVAWLFGRAITRRAIAPLQAVASALHGIAAGDFTPAPLPSEENALRGLTAAYNEVALRLTAATVQRERNELQMRQFVADAGHELRTPLTIVMGYLEMLQRGAIGESGVEHVYETMLAQSHRMRAAIDKLILLARLERPGAAPSERVDVGAILRRAADALAPLAGAERIAVAAPGTPCLVVADQSELVEAIKNVIENALRYAPESPVRATLACENTHAVVMVEDEGPGMEPSDLEHAFDRFYRGAGRTGEGSGLGLAIAKRAIERANGTISLQSRPGWGTRVTISIPRRSD
ncbi:MAG: HAMP domain-containing histidine kinase [Candidatus Eremiobacteraeota bacterium]|nr:HAMP domain-containing histidine kinase [Candidatus Eremiobacteraeota bacterium]